MNAYLRTASGKDMELLYQWANDLTVRKNSFSTNSISYEEHQERYQDILSRPDCRQYIYMEDGKATGQVRITVYGKNAKISYSICREKKGMGHGKKMLQLLYRQVKENFPDVEKLTAKVKPNDVASQQVFLDAGYDEKYSFFELNVKNVKPSEYFDNEKSIRGGVLFLTNNRNTLPLYNWLRNFGTSTIYSEKISLDLVRTLSPDIIVSYNYNYLISNDIINYMDKNVINLHISCLPWNRGSSPNIWSFIEDTPKGVTIHQVDEGLDTGKILFQKECCFDPEKETFTSTYNRLNEEIISLFKENWGRIYSRDYEPYAQKGQGSYHTMKDLKELKDKISFDWADNISEFLKKYRMVENS